MKKVHCHSVLLSLFFGFEKGEKVVNAKTGQKVEVHVFDMF